MSFVKEVPAELISALAAKMEAEPALQKQLNALLAIKDSSLGEPAPKEAPLPAAPAKSKEPDSTKKEIDAQARPELEEASDMLSLVPEVNLPRRVKYQHNFFVPNFTAMFFVLYQMDKYVIRKFKARRAAQLFCPPLHIVYFAELICYQVLRCLSFAGYLPDSTDQVFLDTLLKRYPPEILPIPGFLLPYFKAITTYIVQNKQHKRVSPAFPNGAKYFDTANDYHYVTNNSGSSHFPIPPLLISVARKFVAKINETSVPKAPVFTSDNWPLGKFKTTAGHTTEYSEQPDFGYLKLDQDTANWTVEIKSAITSPGLRAPVIITKDVIANLSDGNIDDFILPEPSDMKKANTYQEFMCMTDLTWFRSFLGPMSDYANLFNGSGTLADCSPDGPPVGAYVFSYTSAIPATPSPLADGPITMLDGKVNFEMIGQLRTTEPNPDPITERLAVLTHIHARLPAGHFFAAANHTAARRNGNVWNQRPIYGPTVEHEELESFPGSVARYVKKIYNA